jgi:hypothetical protein
MRVDILVRWPTLKCNNSAIMKIPVWVTALRSSWSWRESKCFSTVPLGLVGTQFSELIFSARYVVLQRTTFCTEQFIQTRNSPFPRPGATFDLSYGLNNGTSRSSGQHCFVCGGPVFKYRPGYLVSWLMVFMVFLSPFRQTPGWYFRIGYDRFLPKLFNSLFIQHPITRRHIIRATDSVVK